VNKKILKTILILSICMVFTTSAWAGDDDMTAKKRAACDDGNSAACFAMGEKYRVVEQDNKTALEFFRKACNRDYMTGCTHGGILLFMSGTNGSAQWREAKKMFQKACDAEEDPSCYNLGTLSYKEGRQEKAIKYYKKACRMGNQPGCAREQKLALPNIKEADRLVRERQRFEEERRKLEDLRLAEKNRQLEEERKKLEEERKKFEDLRLAEENRQQQAQAKKKPAPQSGTGSGFFVSKMGHVITNAHVVHNCNKVTIGDNANKQVPAELINTDRSNDLALLKLSTLEMASAESKSLIQKLSIVVVPLASKGLLRSEDVRLGEKVLVAGYPFGELFSNTIKVTTGVVSATRGAGDDSGQFQLDAAIQPGNSGGPIYDSGGNIVGVVISQLDKLKMAKAIGTLPELVNFGIKASTVRQFLTSSGLPSKKSERTEEKSTEQLAEIAKNQALMVMCLQ
jgi:S1-C subfamily serine protease